MKDENVGGSAEADLFNLSAFTAETGDDEVRPLSFGV
jgi:hypothetical protein